ncbi:MAG: M23 family metallopeptidase [Spirosomaceae bacterium]|nr:M23 family metallopeptidase [Spirosomataceae bacterium]
MEKIKSTIFSFLLLQLFAVGLISCSDNLPKKTFSPFPFEPKITRTADSLFLEYVNEVACPVQLKINTNFPDPSYKYATRNPIIVPAFGVLKRKFKKPDLVEIPAKYFSFAGSEIGNPAEVSIDTSTRYAYPFPRNKSYKIIQGYNGNFSHKSDYSRYAVDFALAIGDTVCAARDGIVVGVVKDYNIGGNDRKYRDYANFITLYHADGTFTQYVHLKQNGAFVAIGDTVRTNQPIGLSGMTGFTSIPHLHFNVLKPTFDGAKSFPVKFFPLDGKDLKTGMKVQH